MLHRARACLIPVIVAVGVVTAAGRPAPGAPPQSPPPATSPDMVPVNVHVLDKAGKAVTDLKASDFTILENGVPQKVVTFAPLTLDDQPASGDARPAVRKGLWSSPQTARLFVFVLGRGRLEESSKTVGALLSFVRTKLVPRDVVAVFAYDRALSFTHDHARAAEMLERFRRANPDIDSEIELQMGPLSMAPLYGTRVLPAKVQKKIDALFDFPGSPKPAPGGPPAFELAQFARLSLDDFMFSTALTLHDDSSLVALLEYLARLEGEKHVVYITEKEMAPWPSEESDAALAAVANDARVSLHTVQAGGLLKVEANTDSMDTTQRQALALKSLRNIAERTGGTAAIMENAADTFERLDQVTRSDYLLGYLSTNPTWDGSHRKITVKVNRPDATVYARGGYDRVREPSGFARQAFVANHRLLAGANFRREVNDIKVKTKASQKTPGQLTVEGTIALGNVGVEVVNGLHVGELEVAVFCSDSGGWPTGTQQTTLHVKLNDEEFARYQKSGMPYSLQFPLDRGVQTVRFIVYDYKSDRIGRADTKLF